MLQGLGFVVNCDFDVLLEPSEALDYGTLVADATSATHEVAEGTEVVINADDLAEETEVGERFHVMG